MLRSIRIFLDELNNSGIKYSHWKSNEHLDKSMMGDTDLDMLFCSSQKRELEAILNRCDLKRFRATTHMQYHGIEDFIGFDKETAKIWHLHLHYKLTLGEKHLKGYTLPWSHFFLENRLFDNEFNIYRSSAEDEYFLLLLRIALKLRWRDVYRRLGTDDMNELSWLRKHSNQEKVIEVAKYLVGDQCAAEYKNLLSGSLVKKSEFIKLQKLLRKKLKNFTSYSLYSSFRTRIIREFFWAIGGISRRFRMNSTSPSRRVSPSGGSVVAIIGCDGAGKSTTIEYICREFGKKIDVFNIYLGSGDGQSSIIRYPMRFVAKRIGGKGLGRRINNIQKGAENRKTSIKEKIYSFSKILWAIALALEKNKKLKKITKARNNSMLVISDRYPQTDVMGYNDGPLLSKYFNNDYSILKNISRWESMIYNKAYLYAPDLTIKLIVPTSLAMERKPEMIAEEIERKKNAVEKINYSTNMIEINTSNTKLSSFSAVMEEIWKIL